jgi:hypothetical protein
MDKYNIPCHGCRHQSGLPDDCPNNRIVSIPDDWMYEPHDCVNFSVIDAGISLTESLGRRLFE